MDPLRRLLIDAVDNPHVASVHFHHLRLYPSSPQQLPQCRGDGYLHYFKLEVVNALGLIFEHAGAVTPEVDPSQLLDHLVQLAANWLEAQIPEVIE